MMTQLNEPTIVEVRINGDDILQSALLLCRTPRSASQSLDIVAQHRERMVDGKQGIPSRTFQFALPRQ